MPNELVEKTLFSDAVLPESVEGNKITAVFVKFNERDESLLQRV